MWIIYNRDQPTLATAFFCTAHGHRSHGVALWATEIRLRCSPQPTVPLLLTPAFLASRCFTPLLKAHTGYCLHVGALLSAITGAWEAESQFEYLACARLSGREKGTLGATRAEIKIDPSTAPYPPISPGQSFHPETVSATEHKVCPPAGIERIRQAGRSFLAYLSAYTISSPPAFQILKYLLFGPLQRECADPWPRKQQRDLEIWENVTVKR